MLIPVVILPRYFFSGERMLIGVGRPLGEDEIPISLKNRFHVSKRYMPLVPFF